MTDYFRLPVEQALADQGTTAERGLTAAEAAAREEKVGKNTLPTEEGNTIFQVILSQFTDIMVIVLIVAAVVSALLGDLEDAVVILVIVVLNAALGTYQEYRAEQALAALSAMQVPQVRVRRDGQVQQISAEDLVPGDIVLLQEGEQVPADGRVITSINLQVEEAALTGESQGVYKNVEPITAEDVPLGDRKNMVFMGTAITYGRGEFVVTGTGLETQLGNIAKLLMGVGNEETPLQKRLDQLSRYLVIGAVGVVIAVFVVGLLRGLPFQEMLLTSISLAVAAVPEGLPAVITIALSLGATRMVRRNALIRKLPAVETLGSVTTICTDKTGTLTKNEMTATMLAIPGHDDVAITGIGYNANGQFVVNDQPLQPNLDTAVARLIKAMALNTDAYLEGNDAASLHVVGDTTEGALVVAAEKAGFHRDTLEAEMPRIGELPFSSERKAMTTVHQIKSPDDRDLFADTGYLAITKGAPDRLVDWATQEHSPDGVHPLTEERRAAWHNKINEMASKGLRVLGISYRPYENAPPAELTPEMERELSLLGLVGILDPARPEAKEAIKVARGAGIRSIMITGDHALTAETIAEDLGIITPEETVITGSEIEKMDDAQLSEAVKRTSAFARVSPEHKLRLVKVLQGQNQVVAMTGDGVNDAPALKQADIGVAMGITGTEVSKGAADMVLTDDNYASIVSAVEEGRLVYDNIRKFVLFLLSSNVGEILVMFVGILIGLPVPLLAIQILWVNLLTDGLPAIALGFDPPEPDLMKRQPRDPDESIFANGIGARIIRRSILLGILTLVAFYLAHTINGLDPFSPTRGLERLSREQVVQVTGSEDAPANWDTLTPEERITAIEGQVVEGEAEGSEALLVAEAERMPRTVAFTVLALGQIFHVIAIHAGERVSFFSVWFSRNRLMLYAILATVILQGAVIYLPFLQNIFETYPLNAVQLLGCVGIAAIMLGAVEIEKAILRARDNTPAVPPAPQPSTSAA